MLLHASQLLFFHQKPTFFVAVDVAVVVAVAVDVAVDVDVTAAAADVAVAAAVSHDVALGGAADDGVALDVAVYVRVVYKRWPFMWL